MRRGILTPLHDEFSKIGKKKKSRKHIKLRIPLRYLTDEEKKERKREINKIAVKRFYIKKEVAELAKKNRIKLKASGLELLIFTKVPVRLKQEINFAATNAGIQRNQLLEQMFRAWEGYKNI